MYFGISAVKSTSHEERVMVPTKVIVLFPNQHSHSCKELMQLHLITKFKLKTEIK